MKTHLFAYPGSELPTEMPVHVSASALAPEPVLIAEAVDQVLRDRSIDTLVFWDTRLCPVPWSAVDDFKGSLDDAWHPGWPGLGVDLLRYSQPLWNYRPQPAAGASGVISWRFDLSAVFLRANVVRGLGGFDRQFETMSGMATELGHRLVRRGAVGRQFPALAPTQPDRDAPSLADAYRLARRATGAKWTFYSLARRVIETPLAVRREVHAWRASASVVPSEPVPIGALERNTDALSIPAAPKVSVVLPTFGRYRYLAEVLEDLRAQSVPVSQILVADGNPASEREPDVYRRFEDLPLDVLWHEEPGICSGRNACLQRATGDYVWFVDDDSRFDAKNLESHLRVLAAYGADVSVGPAYTKGRPDLTPEQREIVCTFMDCGTTLVKRELLGKVGGFDMQFNQYLAGEDGDLGLRFIRAGGLMLNNPLAKRFHYHAPIGGSRSKGSAHRFKRWALRPRPVQSVYYLARRHFERGAVWDAMIQASITVGLRRPAAGKGRVERIRIAAEELLALPLTVWRFWRSVRVGSAMVTHGPQIPNLDSAQTDHGKVMRIE